MRRTTFTAEIRALLCEQCGAPLEAPVDGGAIVCTYCRAQNLIATRDERPTLGMPAMPTPIDEQERMRRLRSQDGKPMIPPASIIPLLEGSSFAPSKVQEAFMIYQATRREVKTTHSPDAAERLYFLTLVASNYLTQQGDDTRRRAILETTLDTVFLPRHKQGLRCQLASSAALEHDIVAAERWIAPCDARSDDLDSDSAYRVSRALIDSIKRDYPAVLATLGGTDDHIPIADARDPIAAVLRANALERIGDLPGAVRALRERMGKENAEGRQVMEEFIARHPGLQLCPQSFAEATTAHTAVAAKSAASRSGGGVGLILLVVGVGLLLLGVFLMCGSFVPTMLISRFSPTAMIGGLATGITIALGPLIAGVVMTLIGFGLHHSAREAQFLRLNGIRARGTIRSIETTGTTINDVPLVRFHLTVHVDGQAPYEAVAKQLATPNVMMSLGPGKQVALRVHPKTPSKVMMELD